MNNTFDIILEVNEEDNYANFINKLCPILMNYIEWTPVKQYIIKNDYSLQANDILLYFMPPECDRLEHDLIILIADPVLPCDLDYALPRLPWAIFYPDGKIQDILIHRDGFNLLITPGKRISWRRNSMDILIDRYYIKGFDGINIMRLNAIAADYLNAFTVDTVNSHTFSTMITPPLKFSNLDNYDLIDKELILNIENVVHSSINKQSVYFDD
jgi:hypothetical protein